MKNKVVLFITNIQKKKRTIILFAVVFLALTCVAVIAQYVGDPMQGRCIIIDPGHGGIDPGTNDATFLEKDINLQIAYKVQSILFSNKVHADLTRYMDISLDKEVNANLSRHEKDLLSRVNKFNSGKYDIYVSIHVNSSSDSRMIGPMVLYSRKLPQSVVLANHLQENLNQHIKTNLKRNIKRNPIKSDYYILRNSNIPGVLIETGFISNPVEKKNLKDEAFQAKIAQSICEGIYGYFKAVDSSKGSIVPNGEEDSPPFNISTKTQLVER